MDQRRRAESDRRRQEQDERAAADARLTDEPGTAWAAPPPSSAVPLPLPLGEARDRGHRDPDRDAPAPAAPSTGDADAMRAIEILSHELRSPITTIHLGTKVLREGGRRMSRPVRTEVVEAVEEEAERLYRLVEDLLAVARHDGGRTPLPVGPLLLQHWLPPVIAAEVHAAPALRVRASLPPTLPPVLADDGALAQVIRNLLANAVRYASDGMPVEVVAWPAEDDVVRLEVLDRGPGIDSGEAVHLFEPFYRSPRSASMGSAAGLGLAAAQRLLSAMGGSIEATPREGGGARFVVRLPVARPVEGAYDDEADILP